MSHRTIVRLLLLAAVLALPARAAAQETRTVTGRVTATETGEPMGGVLVSVKGATGGALTDAQGNFTLNVSPSANTLTFSHVGFRSEEFELTGVTGPITVSLDVQAIGLEGIVVTALGVQREKRSLGYSVQDLSGDALAEVPKLNIVNALQGNVAGVHITNAGPTGGSSRIVIRGANSLMGNNQPLFIVDGIPVDNSAPRNRGFGGIDYGNAVQDIGLDNIESVSVLKGPNAAALYGSRAANGAIVIETKSGGPTAPGSLGMSATMSLTAETPLRLPRYQNLYGQGLNGEYAYVDGNGGGTWDHVDESWGPRLDGRPIDQFTGPQQPWLPNPNNVRDFFDTGRTLDAQVAVSRAGENSNVRLALSNTNVNGMFPGNTINRYNVTLRGGANVTDRLTADASLNYMNQDSENRSGTGYDEDNPMQQFIWFGRQVDMSKLRNFECRGGEPTPCTPGAQYNWNYNYHNNPFWEQFMNGNGDQRDRVIANLSSTYQVTDWLNVLGRVGRDWYREKRKDWTHHFSLDDDGLGSFTEDNRYRSVTSAELLANATHQVAPDLSVNLMAGAGLGRNDFEQAFVSVDRLVTPGLYTLSNAAVTPIPSDFQSEHEVRSLLGSVSLNYAGYLNVDVTGRNDWSSTLPKGNNSYFYPSVSSAFVFSDAFGMTGSTFSSGKVRASWTRVGSDTDPYRLRSVYGSQTNWAGVPMFSVSGTLANPDLKPEQTTAWEIGTDLGFLDERLGFVLTYYDSRTKDQIFGVQVSRASGFTNQILNAAEVRNFGTELQLLANPMRTRKFNWNVTLNWSKNNSQVRDLYEDLATVVLGDGTGSFWSLDIEARAPRRDENGNIVEYYPLGTMFGNGFLRCTDADAGTVAGCTAETVGELRLAANGMPRQDPVRRVLGKYSPDWQGGIQNRFRYGPAELSVLIDGQKGGNVFSVTDYFGNYAGVLESSLLGRENDHCDPGILVSGILPDGSINGEAGNDVRVCPQAYFGGLFGIQESAIVDASYVKLREVRLGYTLPTQFISRLGFSGGSVALIGRNLAMWSKAENIDPETAFDASNVQGIEFGQHPTERSIGFSISIRP